MPEIKVARAAVNFSALWESLRSLLNRDGREVVIALGFVPGDGVTCILADGATAQERADAQALIEAHDPTALTPAELRRQAARVRKAELRELIRNWDADSNLTAANVAVIGRYLLMRLIEEGDV